MIDLDEFAPYVQINAPGAPEPLVMKCIVAAAIRFCERTRLWREFDTIPTDGEDPETIPLPPDSALLEVAGCSLSPGYGRHDAIPLDPISLDDLVDRRAGWRGEPVGDGGARWFVCPQFGTVQAVRRSRGVLSVESILRPTVRARSLPDFLFDLYESDIADGASARLLATPGSEFANPSLALALERKFEMRLGALSNAGQRGQQRATARTRARFM